MGRIFRWSAAAAAASVVLALALLAPRGGDGGARAPGDEERLLGRLHAFEESSMDLARLAQARGSSRLTRRFGQRLERDHDEADARLLRRAQQRGARVAERRAAVEEGRRRAYMESLSGGAFDRALADAVESDEARAEALLRAERSLTPDRRTRREVDAVLPLVQEHRRLARFLQARAGGGGS